MNEYKKVRLGDYIKEYSVKNKANENIPVYSVTNSSGFCTEYFSKEVASKDKSTYKIVPKGYFAYNPSRINVGSVDWQRTEERVIVSPLYNVFSISDNFDNQFLYYYLKSDYAHTYIIGKADGSVRDNLKLSQLAEFLIPLPPIETQKLIAATLDIITKIIAESKKLLEKYDLLIKSRFIEMFGDPVSNPMGWEIRALDSLGKWESGGTPPRKNPEYFKGNIPWYSAGELNSLYLEDSIEKITEEAIKNSSAKLFKEGSLFVGMYDTAAFKMGIAKQECSSNQACANIWPNTKTNILWLYYELSEMKEYFLQNRRGVRQKNLNLGMIKGFEIPVPPLELQQQFAAFVQQIDKSKFENAIMEIAA